MSSQLGCQGFSRTAEIPQEVLRDAPHVFGKLPVEGRFYRFRSKDTLSFQAAFLYPDGSILIYPNRHPSAKGWQKTRILSAMVEVLTTIAKRKGLKTKVYLKVPVKATDPQICPVCWKSYRKCRCLESNPRDIRSYLLGSPVAD